MGSNYFNIKNGLNLQPVTTAGTASGDLRYNSTTNQVMVFNGTAEVPVGLPVYDVRSYGVIGNGSTDDKTAINAAITAVNAAGGGILRFPQANYRISDYVTLKSNVWLLGENRKSIFSIASTTIGANQVWMLANDVANVRVSGFKFLGTGSWTATPFVNPYSAGNSVGFTSKDTAITFRASSNANICQDVEVSDCDFVGLHNAVSTTFQVGATLPFKRFRLFNNYCHNMGNSGLYCRFIDDLVIRDNTVAGVYGNQTDAGVTTTAESKYADGIYMASCTNVNVFGNICSDLIRIGIVLEKDSVALVKSKGINVANNVCTNMHDYKGSERNAGIWCEPGNCEAPITITGNTVYTSSLYGIRPYDAICTGNTVYDCDIGFDGRQFTAVGNDIYKNRMGIQIESAALSTETINILDNSIRFNKTGGLFIDTGRGLINIQGNTFEDNGTTATISATTNFAISNNKYYNDQKVVINGNTFLTNCTSVATVGQAYGILGVTGGDFAPTTSYITGNTFLFLGSGSAYPANLAEQPCSFASTTGAVVTKKEIGGLDGNINSKMPQSDLSATGISYTVTAPTKGSVVVKWKVPDDTSTTNNTVLRMEGTLNSAGSGTSVLNALESYVYGSASTTRRLGRVAFGTSANGTAATAGGTIALGTATTAGTTTDALTVDENQNVTINTNNLLVNTVGKGLRVKEGSGGKSGVATLVAGSVVVSNANVTSTSRIQLTSNADGGTPGWLRVSARTASTSFTITSSSGTDTSTVAWFIVEPA